MELVLINVACPKRQLLGLWYKNYLELARGALPIFAVKEPAARTVTVNENCLHNLRKEGRMCACARACGCLVGGDGREAVQAATAKLPFPVAI